MVQTSTNKINFFESVNKILYEGKDSKNPLAFKYYNPEEVVGGKTMKDQLRFSVAYTLLLFPLFCFVVLPIIHWLISLFFNPPF